VRRLTRVQSENINLDRSFDRLAHNCKTQSVQRDDLALGNSMTSVAWKGQSRASLRELQRRSLDRPA
jgi:hypothetical protein